MNVEQSVHPAPERPKRTRKIRELGTLAAERVVSLFKRSPEVPMPEGLRTASGRNPRLEATNPRLELPIKQRGQYYEFPTGEAGVPEALAIAKGTFPDQDFNVLSTKGSSATIFEAGDKAYKVFRSANRYSYIENEIGAMQTLHEEGLAPKPYLLVDAARAERSERSKDTIHNDFSDIQVPRINEGGKVPIIVMDRIHIKPIHTLTDEQRVDAFNRFLEVGQRLDLSFGDTEFVVDADTNNVKIIDTGGISHNTLSGKYGINSDGSRYDIYPSLTEEQFREAQRVASLLDHLSPVHKRYGADEIAPLLERSDTEAIHALLHAPSQYEESDVYDYHNY